MSSYYSASANKPLTFPALAGDQDADICVVGAGYTGLSSALHLAERGYKVIVIEAETRWFWRIWPQWWPCGHWSAQDQQYLEEQIWP